MGYGAWTALKLMKTSEKNIYTLQLKEIMDMKHSMISFTGNIIDGRVTPDELVEDPTNYNNFVEFRNGLEAYRNSAQGIGDIESQIRSDANQQGYDENAQAALIARLNQKIDEEYARLKIKEMSANEMLLDNKKKLLETKISEVTQELQAIEKAEADEIQRSVPKYSGLQG